MLIIISNYWVRTTATLVGT